MRTITLPAKPGALCHFTNRPDAACRRLPRCRSCGRVLGFNERENCHRCMAGGRPQ